MPPTGSVARIAACFGMTPPPSDHRSGPRGPARRPRSRPNPRRSRPASPTTAGVAPEYPTLARDSVVTGVGSYGRRRRRSSASSQAPLATDPGRLADLRRVGRGRGHHRLVLQCEPLDDRRDHEGGRHDGGGPAGRGLLRPQGPAANEIDDVTAGPCTAAHEFEMFFVGSMPEGEYPGPDRVRDLPD